MTPERSEQRRLAWKRLNELCRMRQQLQTDYFDEAIAELEQELRRKGGTSLVHESSTDHRRFGAARLCKGTWGDVLSGRLRRRKLA